MSTDSRIQIAIPTIAEHIANAHKAADAAQVDADTTVSVEYPVVAATLVEPTLGKKKEFKFRTSFTGAPDVNLSTGTYGGVADTVYARYTLPAITQAGLRIKFSYVSGDYPVRVYVKNLMNGSAGTEQDDDTLIDWFDIPVPGENVETVSISDGAGGFTLELDGYAGNLLQTVETSQVVDLDNQLAALVTADSDEIIARDAAIDTVIGSGSELSTPYLKTTSDIMNGQPVSLLRITPDNEVAAIRNYTSAYDIGPNLNTLIAEMQGATRGSASIEIPDGMFILGQSVDFYMPNVRGFTIRGTGSNTSVLKWTGGAGIALDNTQGTADQFQYGVNMTGFSLSTVNIGAGITDPVAGSTGLHIEMAQKHWNLDDVSIIGFDTNLDIGVHAEAGHITGSQFSYGRINVNAYGNQADKVTFLNCWNFGAKETGYLISSPRLHIQGGFVGAIGGYSDYTIYKHVQVGYQAVRAADVNKSSFLTGVDKGGSGNKLRIVDVDFESDGNAGQIVFKDVDTTATTGSNAMIRGCSFAMYRGTSAIEIQKGRDGISTQDNRLSRQADANVPFIDVQTTTCGVLDVREPNITNVFKTGAQYWSFAAKARDFDDLEFIAANPLHPLGVAFKIANPSSGTGLTLVDLDYNGLLETKVTYNTLAAGSNITFTMTNCPIGKIYFKCPVWHDDLSTGVLIQLAAKTGGGTTLAQQTSIKVSQDKRDMVIGFDNDTVQTIRIYLFPSVTSTTGSFFIGEPLIKHSAGPTSLQVLDSRSGTRFTRYSASIHDYCGRLPYQKMGDYDNLTTARQFIGPITKTTVTSGYAIAATAIDVASVTGIAVGDHVWFKGETVAGVSPAYRSSLAGITVSSIATNTLTLSAGLPFALASGGGVITSKVYTV